MTVVYIDSVFVLNTLMDYLLMLSAGRLAGIPLRRGRYALGALLGGAYAVAVFFPGCGFLTLTPVKLAAGVLMALAAYGGEERFLRLTLLLFALSCAMAGCVLGLGLLAGGGVPMAGGVFYTDVDARMLLIAAAAAYVVVSVVFRAAARHGLRGELLPVKLALGGKTVSFTALRDTGNALRDPMTGRGMLVASAPALEPLWPPEVRRLLTDASPAEALEPLRWAWPEARFRLTPYRAVGVEGGLLVTFQSDWTVVSGRRLDGLMIAVSPTALGDGYCALWGGTERGEERYGLESETAPPAPPAGKMWAASGAGRPLHRRQRHAAGSAAPGSGGGAAGPAGRGGRAQGADRT